MSPFCRGGRLAATTCRKLLLASLLLQAAGMNRAFISPQHGGQSLVDKARAAQCVARNPPSNSSELPGVGVVLVGTPFLNSLPRAVSPPRSPRHFLFPPVPSPSSSAPLPKG